jgi:hypothetical protein
MWCCYREHSELEMPSKIRLCWDNGFTFNKPIYGSGMMYTQRPFLTEDFCRMVVQLVVRDYCSLPIVTTNCKQICSLFSFGACTQNFVFIYLLVFIYLCIYGLFVTVSCSDYIAFDVIMINE